MQLPGIASLVFLAYILLVLPWAGFRSMRALRASADKALTRPLPSREAVWRGTFLGQVVLLALAWLAARSFDYRILAVPRLGAREVAAALVALGLMFGLRALLRALRPPHRRGGLMVYRLAPRTRREWVLWVACVLSASVAEEAAFRGAGMAILWFAMGSPWPAVLVCAVAFALAHMGQGRASTMTIFAAAIVLHALAAVTATLVLGMIVHALYDLGAGFRIAREAELYDPEPLPA